MAMPQLILVPSKDNSFTAPPVDKVSSIKSEAEKLQRDLNSLRSEMQKYLEEKQRENTEYLPTIRNAIAFLPASTRVDQIPLFGWKQQTEISLAATFSNVFTMIKQVSEFPDSSLLEHLIRLFGSEQVQAKLLTYTEKLRSFRSHTKVSDFTKACSLDTTLPLEFSILTIKIGREWHRSSLEDIEQLRQSMIQKASLTSYGIRLLQVEWDQGLLHWCVPSRALQSLVGSLDSEFLQENHVELLSINGTHLQSSQSSGATLSPVPSANSVSSPPSSSSTTHQSKAGQVSLLPLSPPSATGGQTGQPLSLQDQLAMVGAQVVQFKPAVTHTNAETKQVPSPTHSTARNSPPVQPTAVQIIHPQCVPSSNGASNINMGRLATLPVMHQPGSQPIQIIHPQIIQPNAIQGGSSGRQIVQTSQVLVRNKSEKEVSKPASSVDPKPSLTQDGFMVMQGGPNGNQLVLVPSYVMVNSPGRQKLTSLSSSPPSATTSTVISPPTLDKKSIGISSQGLATLLQPGTPISPLFSTAQSTKGLPINSMLPVTKSACPISLTLSSGQGKIYENPIVPIPNPAVSSTSPRLVSGTGPESYEFNMGRPISQLKSLNHICTICGNGYMWASSLKRHMHTHTGEGVEPSIELPHPPPESLEEPPAKKAKTIECQICNQMLESPAAYTRHLRLHMKMHRRKEIVKDGGQDADSGGGGGSGVTENGQSGAEEGDEEVKVKGEGKEGERVEGGEGDADEGGGEKNGEGELQLKKEDAFTSSSGSDRSTDSGSETEETMDAVDPTQQDMPPAIEGSSQDSSIGTNQESARVPPAIPISGGLPFNQILQFVGSKERDNEAEEGTSLDAESTVTVARRFRCDECGRYLSSQAALSGHQQCMHNKQKPHVCHICNKGFFQSHSLTVHLRSHSGEKPYTCIVCNKSFSQRSSLNIHIRTHSGERPYQCPFCSRGFSDSSTLAKHRRTHTGERPYQCRECGASFSQSGNLWRHMKQVHPLAAITT